MKKDLNPSKKTPFFVIVIILAVFLGLAFLNAASRGRIRAAVETGMEEAASQVELSILQIDGNVR